MKVLFISSSNRGNSVSPIVQAQADSLSHKKINVIIYPIQEKGLKGYWRTIKPLKAFLEKNNFDLIHAHYSLSGFVAAFAGAAPLVVSLMGSDVKSKFWYRYIIYFFYRFKWGHTIVKTKDMKQSLGFSEIDLLPNGVNISSFFSKDKIRSQNQLGWSPENKHILFPSNPKRFEKNYFLIQETLKILNDKTIEVHTLVNVPHNQVPLYMNASDVVVLTSLWEGSPNAIKEAMACNCPIVSTNVGDVEWLFGDISGHFITSFDPIDISKKIMQALKFAKEIGSTNGRDRIIEFGLDSETVANKIIEVYNKVLKSK